ncbi:mucin-5AC-like [Penaeus japonicus]|uniref:mucin-5AC-like n=1 Tax=Penaeus japonicus TaxID=27405 RepID=UPI001C70BD8B|nr:mucin-5AC-like [Penaeus japonicus]
MPCRSSLSSPLKGCTAALHPSSFNTCSPSSSARHWASHHLSSLPHVPRGYAQHCQRSTVIASFRGVLTFNALRASPSFEELDNGNIVSLIQDLMDAQKFSDGEIRDMKVHLSIIKEENKALRTELTRSTSDIVNTMRELKKTNDRLRYLDDQSRRNNLRFSGIPEDRNENWEQAHFKIKKIVREQLGITPEMERVHRDRPSAHHHGRAHRTLQPVAPTRPAAPAPSVSSLAEYPMPPHHHPVGAQNIPTGARDDDAFAGKGAVTAARALGADAVGNDTVPPCTTITTSAATTAGAPGTATTANAPDASASAGVSGASTTAPGTDVTATAPGAGASAVASCTGASAGASCTAATATASGADVTAGATVGSSGAATTAGTPAGALDAKRAASSSCAGTITGTPGTGSLSAAATTDAPGAGSPAAGTSTGALSAGPPGTGTTAGATRAGSPGTATSAGAPSTGVRPKQGKNPKPGSSNPHQVLAT